MRIFYSRIVILYAGVFLSIGCSTVNTTDHSNTGNSVFYDSAVNDHNRAPASMTPKPSNETLDPVHLRTQADYYFSMGESQSLDGNHKAAIESFKMVLIYDTQSSQVHLRLAAEYVKLGQLTQAMEQTDLALEQNPKSVDALLISGGIYSALKSYDKAITQYEKVLKVEANNTEAPLYMGAVYAELKNYDKAIRYFEKLTSNKEYMTPHLAWYYIGKLRTEQGSKAQLKAAEAAYKKALFEKPNHAESVIALASVYQKMGQKNQTISLFKTFQKEQGPNPLIAEKLAQHYLEQEQYDLAYEQLEILETSSDDGLNAKVKMAMILIEQKKFSLAVVKLQDVLSQVPDSDKIRFYLAAIHEELGQRKDAIENYRKIPSESQYFGEAISHASYLLKQEKQPDLALEMINDALKKRQDVPQFYAIQASFLADQGDLNGSESVLKKSLSLYPDNVQIQFFLGTIQDRLGKKEDCIVSLEKVVSADPNHVQGLNYLAFTYAENNQNLDKAEKLARRAIEIEPNDGFILDTLGWILYKRGEISESIKTLETAFKKQPKESIIAEHLGDAYRKNQLTDKAKKMYQQAVDNETDGNKKQNIKQKISSLESQGMISSKDRKPASLNP
jgi:tetratricopeptide (TPR) repeat protein